MRGTVDRLLAGDRGALAQAISAVQNGDPLGALLVEEVERRSNRRVVAVGVTGPPGAGKSTLLGCLVTQLLEEGHRVGALLVDPSSPISGGAVLADRVRMKGGAHEALYVRSIASRGHGGGIAGDMTMLVRLLEAWGADTIVIETVGAGQGDVDICQVADRVVVVCPPGLGDELQAMKAGLMEIADVFVVNKADRAGADEAVASLESAGRGGALNRRRRVHRTVATTGEGVDGLLVELQRLAAEDRDGDDRHQSRRRDTISTLASAAGELVRGRVAGSGSPEIDALAGRLKTQQIDLETAARLAARHVVCT